MAKGHRRGHRKGRAGKPQSVVLTAFCVALVAILLGMGVYVAQWYINLGRIKAEGERYASLYGGRDPEPVPGTVQPTANPATAAPGTVQPAANPATAVPGTALPTATPVVTERPTSQPTPAPTAAPTPVPTPAPTAPPAVGPDADMPVVVDERLPDPTVPPAVGPDADMPVIVDERLPDPTVPPAVAAEEAAPVSTAQPAIGPDADMPAIVDEPIPTPDADTLVIALPTVPPVQESFSPLLSLNPETIGFLDIEGMLSLPVVQRENDNEYYLNHSFEGAEALEGTLFLDGMNRLTPEDDCLIVYGHNMKNHTMFGRLNAYADVSYLRQHPVVHFDTIYENRSYVAFAAFSASMAPGDPRYFDVRHFIFDEAEFDKFVLKLQSRSLFRSPIEVRWGDRLLLLVTCDYVNREGRFILALRQLRPDENEGGVFAQALQTAAK